MRTRRIGYHRLLLAVVLGTLACSGGGSDSTTPVVPPPPQAQVGTVSGKVTDTGGAAVSGAGLSLSATGKTTLSTNSGTDGRYTFSNVDAGAWTLSITPPTGFTVASATRSVTVAAGQTAAEDFSLDKPAPPPTSGSASVSIKGFAFNSSDLTVTAGTTVTWTNNDNVTHTVTGGAGGPSSGNLAPKDSYSFTFNTKGTFDYICNIHPTMTAKVTVQ